jgi:hypothetical protein
MSETEAVKPSWRDFYVIHPALAALPRRSPGELREFADKLERAGVLLVPVHTRQVAGEQARYLIDGRDRLDACELLSWRIVNERGEWFGSMALVPGVVPKVIHRMGRIHAQIIDEVESLNCHRCHYTAEQLAEISKKLIKCRKMFRSR